MLQTVTLFGHSVGMYDFFNNLAIVAQAICFVLFAKQLKAASTLTVIADMRFNKKKKDDFFHRWVYVLLQFLIMYLPYQAVGGYVGPLLSKIFLHTTDDNFFVNIIFFPLYGIAVALLFRVSVQKFMDFCSLPISVSLVFFKIACYCWGCCNGVECERCGVMNHNTGRVEFPVQLLEAAVAAVMVLILFILIKKGKQKSGVLYPLFMLMYCSTRYITEFWRDDYPLYSGPFQGNHLQCIIGFIEGAVFLFIVLKWGERITAYFDGKNRAFLEYYNEKQRNVQTFRSHTTSGVPLRARHLFLTLLKRLTASVRRRYPCGEEADRSSGTCGSRTSGCRHNPA